MSINIECYLILELFYFYVDVLLLLSIYANLVGGNVLCFSFYRPPIREF